MKSPQLFEFPAEFNQKLEQGRTDFDLLTSIAQQQGLVFSHKFELFPPDLKFPSATTVPSVNSLVSATTLCQNQIEEFKKRLSVMPEAQMDDVNQYNVSSRDLVVRLKELTQEARALDVVYEADLRPWIASVKSPEMLQLGPAANEALEKLTALKQLLQHVESIRQSHSELSKFRLRSDTQSLEATRLCHLTTECEAEVTELNDTNAVLRDSIAREQEQQRVSLQQDEV